MTKSIGPNPTRFMVGPNSCQTSRGPATTLQMSPTNRTVTLSLCSRAPRLIEATIHLPRACYRRPLI